MLARIACALLTVASPILISSVFAQETYSQQFSAASQRRAESSMAQFQSSLSKARASGDRSKLKILLSFNSLVPAGSVLGKMDSLGIAIEELQVSVGEEIYAFPVGQQELKDAQSSVKKQLERSIAQRESGVERMLANETDERTSYWFKENLRVLDAYQAKIAESPGLYISGVGCFASHDQIERLMELAPSLVRAVEFPGTLRMMSIPIEADRGPEE